MRIRHLSVSRSQVWFECKQKYKYRYHLGITSTLPEKPYLTYGKIVHKIIEVYTQEKGAKNINEIKNEVLNGEILLEENSEKLDFNKILPKSYKKRFKSELEAFLKLNQKLGFEGDAEWGFEFDLEPQKQKMIRGIIDRLIQRGDQFIIIDYKTTQKRSSFRKNSKNITQDLQLQCYARVVMEYFKVPAKNIKCALFYLQGGEALGASFSDNTLIALENKMLKIYDNIYQYHPDAVVGNVGDHCKRCEYANICPYYNKLANYFGPRIS